MRPGAYADHRIPAPGHPMTSPPARPDARPDARQDARLAAQLAALSSPVRLAAMRLLWAGGEPCVCDLLARLGVTQSRMSRHMQVLKGAGLVTDRRDAQWVRYRLNPALPAEQRAVLAAVMAALPPAAAPAGMPAEMPAVMPPCTPGDRRAA